MSEKVCECPVCGQSTNKYDSCPNGHGQYGEVEGNKYWYHAPTSDTDEIDYN